MCLMIHEAAPITITPTSREAVRNTGRGDRGGAELHQLWLSLEEEKHEAVDRSDRRAKEHTPCTCQVMVIFDLQSPSLMYCPTKTRQRPPLVSLKGQRSVLHFKCNVTQISGPHGGRSSTVRPGGRFTSSCKIWLLLISWHVGGMR